MMVRAMSGIVVKCTMAQSIIALRARFEKEFH